MKLSISESLSEISESQWNNLAGEINPFIQYDFLMALETGHCLQPYGWTPQYLLAYSDNDQLIGACPAYIKTNSYGEFVFDWAWADAYQRAGLEYYPKLVISIPYSPVTGPRLLAKDNNKEIKTALVQLAIKLSEKQNFSSAHWLFNQQDDQNILQQLNLLKRFDYQFHWKNNNYNHFDDFLSELTSKKRKNIKQERRKVQNTGIKIEIINGNDLTDEQWQQVYNFYQITFMKKHGTATLSLDFFKAIQNKVLVFMAYNEAQPVAAAICIKGKETLYGRHWGCHEEYDSLHFELCYYTGIEYCIKNKLNFFEPGAQGEHKIARGFLPTRTESSHWVAHPEFRKILEHHLTQEEKVMKEHGEELIKSSPFKTTCLIKI
jgi:uncharacterized protein